MKTILFADVRTIGVKNASGEVLVSYHYSNRKELEKYYWKIFKQYPFVGCEVTSPEGEKIYKSNKEIIALYKSNQ